MSLSLVGNHDLDHLEEMALLNFSEVEVLYEEKIVQLITLFHTGFKC